MRRLFRSLIVAVALLTAGGASAALAAPVTQKPNDELRDKAVEVPSEAKVGGGSAEATEKKAAEKKVDICFYVQDILSRTRFKDGTTKAQIEQYVRDQLATMRLPDGVVIRPIDSCFPDTAEAGGTGKGAPGHDKDPGHSGGSSTTAPPKHAPPKVDTAAPARSIAPNFAG